ncbi:UDP-N-acetyl-D-glucosamine dehydrogenase [Clostridium gelidum]|uniref:UDP-N-acetyl-D-glucosamine dehydrogenase n=1 Tax=Clostridium gelidum TaxID=704125 RepID=A0ABN6IY79_9CLOT|nr:nucleotide sugar dehydrogenase [Clostridium gelidum]BCZ47074.1 UDP-N-acetyl-D-glucosamine dehydrogenase [Clostridium gelidum]
MKLENVTDLIRCKETNISEKNKKVCIFGQGFVGLPLALSLALRGCKTIGVDINKNLVNDTNNGVTHHAENFNGIAIQQILKEELKEERYKATIDGASAVRECNNIIVTVGIPIKEGKYIIDYLENVCITIGKNLKKEDLIVIRSTVIPGTTEEVIVPILEKESGLKAGEDFYLAYSSERIAEGKAFDEFANMPTLVAGINKKSCEIAAELLKIVCKAEVIKASCIKVVETSKVFENVQRDVNIAMAQEFARFTEGLGIDIFEVVKLANTHKRVNLLTPGPGVGGYCIPNAYFYIEPKAEEMDIDMRLLKISREENAALPEFIVNKVDELLSNIGKKIIDTKIAVLGLAMKDYSNDDRISPAVEICKLLIKRGAEVKAFDPVVVNEHDFKVNTQDEAIKDAEAVLVLTKQHQIELDDFEHMSKMLKSKAVFIDTKAIVNQAEARKYGISVWRI